MKNCLQSFLGIPNEMMEYGKIKGVRPDLLWQNKYAIEVQHSKIPIEEILNRNQIHYDNNLIPVWVFHQQEFQDENYYKKGNFGIYNNNDDCDTFRLKKSEQLISETYNGLFLLSFSTDYMSLEKDPDYDENSLLSLKKDTGPTFRFSKLSKDENNVILYDIEKETIIYSSEVFQKLVDLHVPKEFEIYNQVWEDIQDFFLQRKSAKESEIRRKIEQEKIKNSKNNQRFNYTSNFNSWKSDSVNPIIQEKKKIPNAIFNLDDIPSITRLRVPKEIKCPKCNSRNADFNSLTKTIFCFNCGFNEFQDNYIKKSPVTQSENDS